MSQTPERREVHIFADEMRGGVGQDELRSSGMERMETRLAIPKVVARIRRVPVDSPIGGSDRSGIRTIVMGQSVGGPHDEQGRRAAVLLHPATSMASVTAPLAHHQHAACAIRDVPELDIAIDEEHPRAVALAVIDARAIVVTNSRVIARGHVNRGPAGVLGTVFAAVVGILSGIGRAAQRSAGTGVRTTSCAAASRSDCAAQVPVTLSV